MGVGAFEEIEIRSKSNGSLKKKRHSKLLKETNGSTVSTGCKTDSLYSNSTNSTSESSETTTSTDSSTTQASQTTIYSIIQSSPTKQKKAPYKDIEIGKGLVNYNASEIGLLVGVHSSDIVDTLG